ncbi:MAG TPA: ABC transporter permease [Blastocatellia bacterium]|nr:ABC transporter permease [Blastocatellia bacterium]
MDRLVLDLRYAIRMLLRQPGFTVVAVVTLALGIGANTAIFSVVNAVLLQPLGYPESDRLVWLSERGPNFPTMSIAYPNFTDWRQQQNAFDYIGVYNQGSYNLTGSGEPERLLGERISADALSALRVPATVGRVFNNDEDKPGASPVVVLSYALWQSRFGADPGIPGARLTLDGRDYAVVGVMPAGFAFPSRVDFWTPAGPLSDQPNWQNRGNHPGLLGVARLKPGTTLDQARVEMDGIAERLEQQYPDSNQYDRVRVEPLLDNYVSNVRPALWTLLGAVGLLLLIACANVANLLLARAAARQREMAVRAALGASRLRVLRQLLTESVVLAAAAATLAFGLARLGVPLILAISRDAIPRAAEIHLDLKVLAFTVAVALLTAVLFGLAPAWQASRPDVQSVLKETSRGATGRRAALRHALVVAEISLTLVLLVGAGLLLRSFYRLQQVNSGFSHERVLSFWLDLPRRKYEKEEQQAAFFQNVNERLRALPGVQSVGYGSQFPLGHDGAWQTGFLIDGRPAPPPGERQSMEVTVASPDYFRTLGIPLVRGRYFTEQDNRDHLRGRDLSALSAGQRWAAGLNVIIVDEEFVRRYWPDEDPIGKRVRLPWSKDSSQQPLMTVVGVVARVKLERLSEEGGFVQVYLSALQATQGGGAVVIKTAMEPTLLAAAARQQVLAVDPDQPIYDMRTLTEVRDNAVAPERLNLTLLGIFAGVALLLAAIGLYGVISYAIAQRTQELGIRMALGASAGNVLRLVIGQGIMLALVGVVFGLCGAWALTRLMRTLLFAVNATDPPTFIAISLLLTFVALLACWIPARRAAQIDPMAALRYE